MSADPFYIGVGGHQDLGDDATQHFVAQQFRELLRATQQREAEIVVYSALAQGADQLFVRVALELGIPVEVVLPCAAYEANYRASQAALDDYRRLLQASRACHQLPFSHCSGEAYLAAGRWIVEHADLVVLAWNGRPARGKGGTAEMAHIARALHRPFIHLHTLDRTMTTYGSLASRRHTHPLASHRQVQILPIEVYRGPLLAVEQYHLYTPQREESVREVVKRPDSVLLLPVYPGIKETMVLLIEEYDLGAGNWQLKLPGGKLEVTSSLTTEDQGQRELREETGYHAGKLERLLEVFRDPGYSSQKVTILLAGELEWKPLASGSHEEIRVQTLPLREALAEVEKDRRCDPLCALALLLYARKHGVTLAG